MRGEGGKKIQTSQERKSERERGRRERARETLNSKHFHNSFVISRSCQLKPSKVRGHLMRWHIIIIHTFFNSHHTRLLHAGETLPPLVYSVPIALTLLIIMPLQTLHAQVCFLDLFHPISCNRSNQLNWQSPASPCYPEEPQGQMYGVQEAKCNLMQLHNALKVHPKLTFNLLRLELIMQTVSGTPTTCTLSEVQTAV